LAKERPAAPIAGVARIAETWVGFSTASAARKVAVGEPWRLHRFEPSAMA
jgi:hypothetical protein